MEQLKQSEKNLLDEKQQLSEKLRIMKTDLNRKEIMNKEMKDKLDNL